MQRRDRIFRTLVHAGLILALSASTAALAAGMTPAQSAEIDARMEKARAIIEHLKPEAATHNFSVGWDVALLSQLLNRPSEDLGTLISLKSYAEVSSAVFAGARSPKVQTKAAGFGTTDLVFHSIAPCRLLDTRNAIGALSGNITRTASMNNSGTQGGLASCSTTIQNADAVIGSNTAWGALALNATVADTASGPAFLRLRPQGSTNTTSFLNWTAANSQVANAGVVALDATGVFEMLASVPTDVIIDVFGVFGTTDEADKCQNVFNATTTTVNAPGFSGLADNGIATCPAGYATTAYIWEYGGGLGGLGPWQNVPGEGATANAGISFTHTPTSITNEGSAITVTLGRRCCRIP